MNKRKHPRWEQFKAEVTNKRSGKNSKQLSAKGLDYLTVQRLSPTVEGKLQKYTRMGPLRMVPMKGELTLNSIKESCKEYFKIPDRMECDLLAGERGPSFTDVTQTKSFKLLHVRFMERTEDLEEHDVLPPVFRVAPLKRSQMWKHREKMKKDPRLMSSPARVLALHSKLTLAIIRKRQKWLTNLDVQHLSP